MKTLTLITICFLFALTTFGQVEFAPIGAQWIQNAPAFDQGAPTFHPLKDYFIIESTGDTIVDNVTYRKVGEYLIHQDGDQIYYLREDSLRLIYDFDVVVGDTVTYEIGECGYDIPAFDFVVQEVTEVLIDQQPLKKVVCAPLPLSQWSDNYEYIEKLGSTIRMVESNCASIPSYRQDWLRCYIDSNISYSTEAFLSYSEPDCFYTPLLDNTIEWNDDYFSVFPNPVKDYLFLTFDEEKENAFQVQLYDALGVKVFQGEMNQYSDYRISMERFGSGLYFIVLEDEAGQGYGKKIWKE